MAETGDPAPPAPPVAPAANDPPPARRRGGRRPPPGIAARLAIGFGLVALLFLVVHAATQRGTWLAATQVARVVFEHEPLLQLAVRLENAIPAHESLTFAAGDPRADDAPATATGTPEGLRASRERLEAVVASHRDYVARRPPAAARVLAPARLAADVDEFLRQGEALLRLGEEHAAERERERRASTAYGRRLDGAPAELAAAWAAVGARFAEYLAGPDAQRVEALRSAENAFREGLAAQVARARGEGGGRWARLRADFEGNVAQRENVIRAERRHARERVRFVELGAQLRRIAAESLAAPARAAIADAQRRADAAAHGAERTLAVAAWVAGGAILLVVALTMLSVVVPVRRLRAEARTLRHLAHHDPLTALPNRRHLLAHLARTLDEAGGRGERVALLVLDVDGFRAVNEGFGADCGDAVLRAVGERLGATLEGRGFVARLGGDEFTIVRAGLRSPDEAAAVADAVVAAFAAPLSVPERELVLGVSVGAAVAPDDAPDAEALLRAAGAALLHAKEHGRGRAHAYGPELHAAATTRAHTEAALARAIDSGEFELLWLPQVDLGTLEVDGAEALLRWRRPDGGWREPREFLQTAARAGHGAPIADWVLQRAVATAIRWRLGPWPEARVVVNLAPQDFADERCAERVERALRDTGLPPAALEFDVPEAVLRGGRADATLAALRSLGVGLALDDFGAGEASLHVLERVPWTRVKLDRALVGAVDRDPRRAALAHTAIRLCHDLGIAITAEGVERDSQVAWLLSCGRVAVQGHWFSPPLAAGALAAFRAAAPERSARIARLALDADARAVATGDSPEVVALRRRRRPGKR